MLKLFENIKFIKNGLVAGVQLNFIGDDVYQIEYTLLKENKSVVEIEKHESFDSFEDLFSSVKSSIPIFLSVDGKGVLHKKVEKDNTQDIETSVLVNQAFPSLKVNDFYIQENKVGQSSIYLSLVRKNKIDELLKAFNDQGYFVHGLTLGPFDIKNILELIELENEFVLTKNYKITHLNSEINDLIKIDNLSENVQYKFEQETISNNNLVSFASAFQYFINYSDYKSDLLPILIKQKEEFLYKKLFNLGGWLILILVFIILLGNFMIFDHYNSRNNELTMMYDQNKNLIIKLEELREELKTKESFIKENSILKTSRLSFYADRIAFLLPRSLNLNVIDIQPFARKIQDDEEIEFLNGIINIVGKSDNSQNFNKWIKKLKKESWISGINIVNYFQDNMKKSGEFEIEILIKNN